MPHEHFNNNRKRHVRPKTNLEKLIKKNKENVCFLNPQFFSFLVYSCTFLATKHSQTIHQSKNPNQNKIWIMDMVQSP